MQRESLALLRMLVTMLSWLEMQANNHTDVTRLNVR